MPHGIKTAIAREQHTSPRDRREMVRIVVDEMRLYELHLSRSDCLTISKIIVKQYPRSFADILKDDTRIGNTNALMELEFTGRKISRIRVGGHCPGPCPSQVFSQCFDVSITY